MQKQLSVRENIADGNGGFEGARQVDAGAVGQGIGQRQAQCGGTASRNRARSQRTNRAPVRSRNSSDCFTRASSGRPWMMTVSMGTVIRACRPIIQSVE